VKTCPVCGKEYPDTSKFCPVDGSTLRAASPTADLVGQVVADRYAIIKKLGEGGMGAVYLGEHVKMGRKSAIKVMNPSMAADPDAISRFNREASNASRISHPNVCQIYDFGETREGIIYLAMEFIQGAALTDIIEREGALAPPRAVRILRQSADALAAAHDLGIVHRDLKPDNIMIVQGRDGADVVKVVDFGIAKAVAGDEAGQKVTKTGLVVGTPEYMSPEQLSGDKLDGRSDIYSLGLVFYRMLTGVLPFQADSAQETMIKRLTDEPMPLAAARPDIAFPPKLQAVLDKALARSPAERYAVATDFAHDAEAAVGGAAVPGTRVAEPVTSAATQLMDAEHALKGQRPRTAAPTAARPRPAPPAKKFPVVPVLGGVAGVGAIAVVAVMMMSRAPKSPASPTPADSGQAAAPAPAGTQTAANTAAANPATANPAPGGRPGGTATRPQPSGKEPVPQPPATQTNPGSGAPDLATVNSDLNAAMDQALGNNPGGGRAAARRYFDMVTLPDSVRAKAAEIIAQSFGTQGDTLNYASWHSQAARLDRKYRMPSP